VLIRFDLVKSDRKDLEDIKASVGDYGSRRLFPESWKHQMLGAVARARIEQTETRASAEGTGAEQLSSRLQQAAMDVKFELRQRIVRYLSWEALQLSTGKSHLGFGFLPQ